MIPAPYIEQFEPEALPTGSMHRFWLRLISDPLGQPVNIPVMVAKGRHPGPVLGLTAATHGNELNGIPAIQQVFARMDPERLHGTLIGVPVVNTVSFVRYKRRFNDGTDLNHIMPGRPEGTGSQVYAHRFVEQIVKHCGYVLDLHTASFGFVNSYYIRADMSEPHAAQMTLLQNAQIILHNPPLDGTLRGAAAALGIPSITLEAGNPHVVQRDMVRAIVTGIYNVMSYLGMLPEQVVERAPTPALQCSGSYWLYTREGGMLNVLPQVTDLVRKGQLVALLQNAFGDITDRYYAPDDAVVIGKSVCPTHQSGGRILHLGIPV